MAVTAIIAGAGLLYALSKQDTVSVPAPEVNNLARTAHLGELATQQAVWDEQLFRPYWYGREPFKRKNATPALSTTRNVMEDVSLRLTPEYKEWMRSRIEDTEFDDVPFRGERASRWAGRDRRRLPFFNHPNSEQAWTYIPQASADVQMIPATVVPDGPPVHISPSRVNHPLLHVAAAAEKRN